MQNRGILILIPIILLAGFGYWWLSSNQQIEPEPPAGPSDINVTYERYSRFGLSFDHPSDMVFSSGVLNGGFDHVLALHGDVQGVIEGSPNSVGVVWVPASFVSSLDDALNSMFDDASLGLESFQKGEKFITTMKGIEVVSQWFSFVEQGTSLTGLAGIWSSELDDRVYVLFHISSHEALTQNDMEIEFQRYLDSFSAVERDKIIGYEGPYYPTQGWRFAKPEEMGLESEKLLEMVYTVNEQGIGADSLLVARDGYIVLDAYFPPFDEGENHIIYSCTKSVVSTLIGIAVEEGYIESLDTELLELYENRIIQNLNTWKEEITLQNLLTMTAGFDARDSYLYDWEGLEEMHDTDDWVKYMLNLPMVEEPGTRFEYTNGVSHLLSAVITETTGMNADEFAEEHLFEPLGITDYGWNIDPTGINWGYSGLYLTPHDMAKIGYLFLQQGVWEGEQIVSENWVKEATMNQVDANTLLPGYGYQWWVSPRGYYSAIGYKGQFIHVVPEYDLVMVTTSSREEDFTRIQLLLETYVIPAVIE